MLKERILSALVLAPIAVWAFQRGGFLFYSLLAIVVFFSANEFKDMLYRIGMDLGFLFVPACLVAALTGYFGSIEIFLGSLCVGLLVLLASTINKGTKVALFALLGFIYLGGLYGMLSHLRAGRLGREWAFMVLFCTWAADVGAFFGGRTYGKHKIAPKISPGKSWEGAIFGLFSASAVSAGWGTYLGLPLAFSVTAGAILAAFAGAGDLAESCFKRLCGVKDSGKSIPGHGGFLDRFDSLLFAGAGGFLIRELSRLFLNI